MIEDIPCPECGGHHCIKSQDVGLDSEDKYECGSCGKVFIISCWVEYNVEKIEPEQKI